MQCVATELCTEFTWGEEEGVIGGALSNESEKEGDT